MAQPGGDVAAREPWRMAAAALHRLGRGADIAGRWDLPAAKRLATILDKGLNSPQTSSAGRLFDAACGLLGVHPVAEFEGQAPMALERMVTAPQVMDGGWTLTGGVLDLLPTLERLAACTDAAWGASLFHGTLVAALDEWCGWAAERTGTDTVALGGGCFFNRVLTDGLTAALVRRGIRPLTAVKASPGDPGLSLGQAWIAGLSD
jgi:hydrogenase maturation protein HypF